MKDNNKSKCTFCLPRFSRIFKRYTALKIVSILLGVYIAVYSYAPVGTFGVTGGFVSPNGYIVGDSAANELNCNPGYGNIYTRTSCRPILAENDLQMLCLGVTRVSAFFMYPSLVLVFTTKLRATMEVVMRSPLSLFTYNDLHKLHVFCGWVVVFDGILHTIFHCIRWANQGTMNLMFDTCTGISGFVCAICILLIGVPMMFEALRKRLAFEVRKYLHYFFIVFCIAMSFHAPLSTIPNGGFACIIFPTLIIWYVLDAMYVYLFWTERIDTTTFHVVKTGVMLTMQVSESFQRRGERVGGIVTLTFPGLAGLSGMHIACSRTLQIPLNAKSISKVSETGHTHFSSSLSVIPAGLCGFKSDNQILVAGGIGITPAISVMRKHAASHRTNLIWAVRDPHMLEFFVKHGEFSSRGWNLIFYTGKEPLYIGNSSEIMTKSGAMVQIILSRPNLQELIPNIIYSIECGDINVPEAFVLTKTKHDAIAALKERLDELDEIPSMTSRQKTAELINYSDELGFLFTELMTEIAEGDSSIEEHVKILQGPDPRAANAGVDIEGGNDTRSTPKAKGETRVADDEKTDVLKKIRGTVMANQSSNRDVFQSIRNRATQLVAQPTHTTSQLGEGHGLTHRATTVSGLPLRWTTLARANGGHSVRRQTATAWKSIGVAMGDWKDDDAKVFTPWKDGAEKATDYVKHLDQQRVLSTWGALYCGGQGPLAEALKKTTKEFNINVALESFSW
ncbi:hypothetical protein ACHAXR_004635 [Thalassiosira sp. AJA248-18]